jgi:hypothetical protein
MKRKKFHKTTIIIFWTLIILLVLLTLINLKFWKYFEKKEIILVPLQDRCSVMFDNLLHTIKDDSGCENYCRAECITRSVEFYKTEFYLKEDSCNICNCYCK